MKRCESLSVIFTNCNSNYFPSSTCYFLIAGSFVPLKRKFLWDIKARHCTDHPNSNMHRDSIRSYIMKGQLWPHYVSTYPIALSLRWLPQRTIANIRCLNTCTTAITGIFLFGLEFNPLHGLQDQVQHYLYPTWFKRIGPEQNLNGQQKRWDWWWNKI